MKFLYFLIVLVLQWGCGGYSKLYHSLHRVSQHFGYRTRSSRVSCARQKTWKRVEEAPEYQYKVQSKSISSVFCKHCFYLWCPHVRFAVSHYSKNRGGLETARFLSKLIPLAPKLISIDASYNLMPPEALLMLCESLRTAKCKDFLGISLILGPFADILC